MMSGVNNNINNNNGVAMMMPNMNNNLMYMPQQQQPQQQPMPATIYFNPQNPNQYYYYHPNGQITTYLAAPNPFYAAAMASAGGMGAPATVQMIPGQNGAAGIYQVPPMSTVPQPPYVGPPGPNTTAYYNPTSMMPYPPPTIPTQQPLTVLSNDSAPIIDANTQSNSIIAIASDSQPSNYFILYEII